jgi:protein TonB
MFEDATFDSRSIQRSQAPRWMLLTLTVNLGVVAAMIVLPLMYPASLPTQLLQRALYVPTAPKAAAQHSAVQQTSSASATPIRNLYQIPTDPLPIISTEPTGNAPAPTGFNISSDWIGGDSVPGGDQTKVFQPNPPTVVHQPQPATLKIGGSILEGMLISKTAPAYPILARTTHTSGTVILAATISKEGTIVNLRVLSGHPLLTQAALDAVKTWRYHPYLLNGQPVEVETTINVIFSMGGR